MDKLNDQILAEYDDAEEYITCANHAQDTEKKTMYTELARQELHHADMLREAMHRAAESDEEKAICAWAMKMYTRFEDRIKSKM